MKATMIIAICAAVIAASVAAVMVSVNRANESKALAEREAAVADKVTAQARIKTAEKDAETEKRRTAEAHAKAKADELEAQKLAKEKAEIDAQAAADNKAAAEAKAKAAEAKADEVRATRDAEKAKADAARSEESRAKNAAKAESAKAEAEASRIALEKLKADRIISEAKLLELRKIDFETLRLNLEEWKRDLEEREQAIKPEKTIADLAWAGGMEDSIIDADGNIKKQEKTVYDPEKDMTLPEASRRLAKRNRLVRETETNSVAMTRNSVVKSMEALYVQAIKDHRVIDAEFYHDSLKSMYPDWEFKGEQNAAKADTKKEEEQK